MNITLVGAAKVLGEVQSSSTEKKASQNSAFTPIAQCSLYYTAVPTV